MKMWFPGKPWCKPSACRNTWISTLLQVINAYGGQQIHIMFIDFNVLAVVLILRKASGTHELIKLLRFSLFIYLMLLHL